MAKFKSGGVTLVAGVVKYYVQLSSQPKLLHYSALKILEKDVLELKKNNIELWKDINYLKNSIAAPRRYWQLIEEKRRDVWRVY